MQDFRKADARTLHTEMRRLLQKKVEFFEASDPEHLTHMWYYPLYKSFSCFESKYPTHRSQVDLILRLQKDAIENARAFEETELLVQQLFGHSLSM